MEDIWGFQDLFIFSPRIRRFTLFFSFLFFSFSFNFPPLLMVSRNNPIQTMLDHSQMISYRTMGSCVHVLKLTA